MSEQRVSDERLARIIRNGELLSSLDADWKAAQDGMAIVRDLIDARAESARLRAVLIEAQECIDYGTRAGGAAEVLAHIATVLKGDGHATVERGVSATTGREMAVVQAAKEWRHKLVGQVLAAGVTFSMTPEVANLLAAVNHLLDAENVPPSDESWQARRAELLRDAFRPMMPRSVHHAAVFAALDRAFEFGREGRT